MTKERNMIIGAVVVGLIVGFGVGYVLWGTEKSGSLVVNHSSTHESADHVDVDSAHSTQSDAAASIVQIEQNQAAAVALSVEQNVATHDNFLETMSQPAGMSVLVSHAKLSAPVSWVAVHDDNNGDLGNVLGARSFAAGEYKQISVPLLRGTVTAKKYHVGIYIDNGDKKFDRKTDTMIRAEDGEMVGVTFLTQ